jgi:uncharacterized membrane protein
MNAAQAHLAINHFPVIGTLLAVGILLAGILLNQVAYRKLAYVLLLIFGLMSPIVESSGENAEELVEEISGVSHSQIHEHEDQAELAVLGMYVLAALSVFGFWAEWKELRQRKALSFISLGAGLIVFLLMARTAHSGGLIRHPEINSSFQQSEKSEDE